MMKKEMWLPVMLIRRGRMPCKELIIGWLMGLKDLEEGCGKLTDSANVMSLTHGMPRRRSRVARR